MNDGRHGTENPGRVLVTGGTGFIGGYLIRALLSAGHPVRALVREKRRALELGAELFEGDLVQPESLRGVEEGVDTVVHCASLLGKWGTEESRLEALNTHGGLHLLRRFEGTGLRRFLHLSAGGVTGPLPNRTADESSPCRPATAYERTKLRGEQEILRLGDELGLPVAVVRPTFTYGPGDPHKIALFRAVKKGRYAFIGGGESVNHPVFIDDLISGILLALEHARVGEVYIVGGERPTTKRELVYAIADALGVRRPRFNIPLLLARPSGAVFELMGRTLGFEPMLTRSRVMMMADDFGYSIDKARRELGYAPKISLEEGIRLTVERYRKDGLL